MKPLILFLLLLLPLYAYGQDVIPLGNPTVATDHDNDTTPGVLSQQQRTVEMVTAAIDKSDLRPLKKRRLKNALRRPAVAEQVTDWVTSNAIYEGIITINPTPVYGADGEPDLIGVDWDSLLAFIEKLIPLILQLIELFS